LERFTAMGLSTSDVKTLYKVFDFIDNEKEGNITIRKVLTLLDIQRTRFNERIFSIFDKGNAGRVDLYAFVVSLWKFCSLVDSATICEHSVSLILPRFATIMPLICVYSDAFIFEMYDTDADGKLSMDEVERLFKEFFLEDKTSVQTLSSPYCCSALCHICDICVFSFPLLFLRVFMLELMKKTDAFGMVHIKHFLSFCKPRQHFFSAVFTVQKALQEATLGVSGWKSVGGRVIGIHFGLSLPVTEVMALVRLFSPSPLM